VQKTSATHGRSLPVEFEPALSFAVEPVCGDPDHPQVTIHFLNSVLKFRRPVVHEKFVNPIQEKEPLEDK